VPEEELWSLQCPVTGVATYVPGGYAGLPRLVDPNLRRLASQVLVHACGALGITGRATDWAGGAGQGGAATQEGSAEPAAGSVALPRVAAVASLRGWSRARRRRSACGRGAG
jgi:hypothetical protein